MTTEERNAVIDEALLAIHMQRCERNTPWDRAILAAAAAVAALKMKPTD